MEKNFEQLYFIAIIPPEPVYTEAWQLKHHFKDRYNSKASLNSPPHITLHMPFKWKAVREHELIDRLAEFTATQPSLHITLRNFSAFEPRVIFIDVVKHDDLIAVQKNLKRFCKVELNLFNADYKDLPFYPHLTLAFRDLKKAEFYKAWDEFRDKKVEATFRVDSIVLLKHDEKEWKEFNSLSLLAE